MKKSAATSFANIISTLFLLVATSTNADFVRAAEIPIANVEKDTVVERTLMQIQGVSYMEMTVYQTMYFSMDNYLPTGYSVCTTCHSGSSKGSGLQSDPADDPAEAVEAELVDPANTVTRKLEKEPPASGCTMSGYVMRCTMHTTSFVPVQNSAGQDAGRTLPFDLGSISDVTQSDPTVNLQMVGYGSINPAQITKFKAAGAYGNNVGIQKDHMPDPKSGIKGYYCDDYGCMASDTKEYVFYFEPYPTNNSDTKTADVDTYTDPAETKTVETKTVKTAVSAGETKGTKVIGCYEHYTDSNGKHKRRPSGTCQGGSGGSGGSRGSGTRGGYNRGGNK